MKFSMVIPCWNAEPYIFELLDALDPQMRDDVEVILVDDGSDVPVKTEYEWCKLIRKKNGGCMTARNKGMSIATGEYITFLDADDLVPEYYVDRVLQEIEEHPFDVCDVSWKSLSKEGMQCDCKLRSRDDWLTNPSACTRIFSRAFIGKRKYNTYKDATEDEDFSRKLGYLDRESGINHTAIPEYMYFYRTAVVDSKSKKFKQGLCRTKRITHHYNHVTKQMEWLLDTIKEQDKENEVWLLTNRCDIPELKRYCQIHTPFPIWTHYFYGEPYNVEIITPPVQCDIILYINYTNIVGGIETFIDAFTKHMGKHYDITVIYSTMAEEQVARKAKACRVVKYDPKVTYKCNTLIMLRILDKVPANIKYDQMIRTCHACRTNPSWHIPQDADEVVCVSESSKESFGDESKDAKVIHNLIDIDTEGSLLIVSATRMPASDKGQNEMRIRTLADMLNKAGIRFTWLNFSDGHLNNPPKNFHNCGMDFDMQPIMRRADYVALLSDSEAFPYAVLEALVQNTAVIVTPFPSIKDLGIIDGVNGYVVPYDMNFDVKKLLNVPEFEYEYDNESLVKEWQKLIGKKRKKKQEPASVHVKVLRTYKDLDLNMTLQAGSLVFVKPARADLLVSMGLVERI